MARSVLIVDLPPQPLLRKMARAAGKSPQKYVQDLMLEHGTQALAAEAIGVGAKTFGFWVKRVELDIRRESAA